MRFRKVFVIFCVFAAFLIHVCCGGGGEKIELKLNLKQGNIYPLSMVADQVITQKIPGQKIVMSQKLTMAFDFKVVEKDELGYVVAVTYRRIAIYQKGPTGTIDYDSSTSTGKIPLLAKGYAALVGERFTVELSPEGDLTDVSGVDDMINRMVDKIDFQNPFQKETVRKQLKAQFGDEELKNTMKGMMSIYPVEPVAVGDTWKKQFILSGTTPMILNNRWKLKDRRGGIAYIDVSSKGKPNPDAEPINLAGNILKYELSGEQKGMLEMDESTGWTLRAILDQVIKGKVNMGALTWPIEIRGTVTLTSK